MNTDRCIQVYNNAMKELVARYIQFHDSSKTIDCYIEDYDDIKNVYQYYELKYVPKDNMKKIEKIQ